MILNPCVIKKTMEDERVCKLCKEKCSYAGRPTTEERQQRFFISSNTINGKTMYIIARIKDPTQPDHSGNRDMIGGYVEDKAMLQEIVDRLNYEENQEVS